MLSSPTHTTGLSIPQLRAALSERVIVPDDDGYDAARSMSRVSSLARDSDVEITVRSGGHSLAGHSVSDGGIGLDLSEMCQSDIDARRHTTWAETGLTAAGYTAATASAIWSASTA